MLVTKLVFILIYIYFEKLPNVYSAFKNQLQKTVHYIVLKYCIKGAHHLWGILFLATEPNMTLKEVPGVECTVPKINLVGF